MIRYRFRFWTAMFDDDLRPDGRRWAWTGSRWARTEDPPGLILLPPDTGLDPWEAPEPPKPLSAEEADRLLAEDVKRFGDPA